MDLPAQLLATLEADEELAKRHDIPFTVAGRPEGSRPPFSEPPLQRGPYERPIDAVLAARSIDGYHLTVLADGRGAYWHTSEPDHADSALLRMVCRDKALSPEQAEREHQREQLHSQIERLDADAQLAEAAAITSTAATKAEARNRLRSELGLTPTQANHLLSNRRLELLTSEGRRTLDAEIESLDAELKELGPAPEVEL